jgi:hypothetical protein
MGELLVYILKKGGKNILVLKYFCEILK